MRLQTILAVALLCLAASCRSRSDRHTSAPVPPGSQSIHLQVKGMTKVQGLT